MILIHHVPRIQPSQALVLVVSLAIRHVQVLMRKTKYHNQIPMKEILECVQDKVEEEEGTGASKEDLLSWLAKYKAQMVVYEA